MTSGDFSNKPFKSAIPLLRTEKSKMQLPRFSAESSLYKTSRNYYMGSSVYASQGVLETSRGVSSIRPEFNIWDTLGKWWDTITAPYTGPGSSCWPEDINGCQVKDVGNGMCEIVCGATGYGGGGTGYPCRCENIECWNGQLLCVFGDDGGGKKEEPPEFQPTPSLGYWGP